jgi:predicted phage-related endonuclease
MWGLASVSPHLRGTIMSLTEKQLAERKRGIFGSEASILEGCHYKCDLNWLWHIKTLRHSDKVPDMLILRMGHYLEPAVAEEYCRSTGKEVRMNNRTVWDKKHTWDGKPFMGGHIDRKVMGQDKILECKVSFTMNKWGRNGSCEIPPYYVSQIKHYCSVFGYNRVDLAVLHLVYNPSFRIHSFEFSDKELSEYRDKAYDFWGYVIRDEEPPVGRGEGTKQMLRERYPMAETGVHTVADDSVMEAISRYDRFKSAIRKLKNDQTEYGNKIMRHMEKSESLLNPQGEEVATYKNDTKGVRRLTIK